MIKKIRYLTILAFAGLGLCACHAQTDNPLITQPKSNVANFIYRAESYATQKTHLYDATQSIYAVCVTNPNHFVTPFNKTRISPCTQYFKQMALYAHTTNGKFSTVSVDNLKDKQVLARLGKVLQQTELNGVTSTNP